MQCHVGGVPKPSPSMGQIFVSIVARRCQRIRDIVVFARKSGQQNQKIKIVEFLPQLEKKIFGKKTQSDCTVASNPTIAQQMFGQIHWFMD
jgi:hypothetical protein